MALMMRYPDTCDLVPRWLLPLHSSKRRRSTWGFFREPWKTAGMDREEANVTRMFVDTKLAAFSWYDESALVWTGKSIVRPWNCHAQWICSFSVCNRDLYLIWTNWLVGCHLLDLCRTFRAQILFGYVTSDVLCIWLQYVGQWLLDSQLPHGLCQAQQLKRDLAKPHNSVGSPWRTNSQGRGGQKQLVNCGGAA